MKEKIKKILFMKSKWFFLIFILFPLFFLSMILEIFVIDWEAIRVINWQAISVIALIITAVVISFQAWSTKKLADSTLVPSITVLIESEKPQKTGGAGEEKKLGTRLFLQNHSNFPIWVWTKMDLKIDGIERNELLNKPLLGERRWQLFPNSAFETNTYDFLYDFVQEIGDLKEFENKKIRLGVSISYTSLANQKQKSEWVGLNDYYFDSIDFEWKNSLGIPDPIPFNPRNRL